MYSDTVPVRMYIPGAFYVVYLLKVVGLKNARNGDLNYHQLKKELATLFNRRVHIVVINTI